jgi:hypothetical protein
VFVVGEGHGPNMMLISSNPAISLYFIRFFLPVIS